MTWTVYSRLMRPILQDFEPVQPKREDGSFLRYAEKPPMPDIVNTEDFYLEEQPIEKVVPRQKIDGLNFKALQYWLDHLGPAIYNPISAYLDEDGEYHVGRDGSHRTRCLWEIGEPAVRLLTRRTLEKSPQYLKWVKSATQKFPTPTVAHFKVNPHLTWRQYYPCIYPPSDTLMRFYEEKKDGAYYRDTLDTPATFKAILSQNKNLSYRFDILDEILKFNVKENSVLDLGCYFGHYMFLLLEAGATRAIGVDNNKFRVQVANSIAQRRGISKNKQFFKALHGDINNYVETTDEHFDIVLLLNVFHHLLAHDEARAWNTLNTLLDRCEHLFIMTGNVKGVYDEWGGDIEAAIKEKTGATLNPLIKSRYRNRALYVVER